MAAVGFPPVHLLQDFFKHSVSNFETSLCQKIKDSNTARSTVENPHGKLVVTYPVHRLVYTSLFAPKFIHGSEKVYANEKAGSQHKIQYLRRCAEIIGAENLVKVTNKGDTALVCPWSVLKSDLTVLDQTCTIGNAKDENHPVVVLEKGSLVIPMECLSESDCSVFVPSGGVEPEYEGQEHIVMKHPVTSITGELDPADCIKVFPLRKSNSSISVKAKDNWFSVAFGEVKEGETLYISGQYRKIVTVGPDAFKPNSDLVTTDKPFERNVKSSKFCLSSPSLIAGRILSVPKEDLITYHPILFTFKKINKNEHGLLHISYYNAVFNDEGFLTHDTAITEGELEEL